MNLRALMTRRSGYDVLVDGLSPDQVRSLATTLSGAALEIEADPGHGSLCIPWRRNKVFRAGYAETVIREWLAGDQRRHASITPADGQVPAETHLESTASADGLHTPKRRAA